MSVPGLSVMLGLFSSVNTTIDRLAAAGELPVAERNALLHRQLRSLGQTAPALLAGSLLVSAIFLVLTWGSPQSVPLAACLLGINLIYGVASIVSGRPQSPNKFEFPFATVIKAIGFAAALGALWGATLNILPLGSSAFMSSAFTIGFGGIVCVSMMALAIYPQALIAFTLPLVVGAFCAMLGLHSAGQLWLQGMLLAGFTVVMVVVALRQARWSTERHLAQIQEPEKRGSLGLLLHEFELNSSDWIWGCDEAGRINRISGGFTAATGVSEDALLGADFVHFLVCITPPDDLLMGQLALDIDERRGFHEVELLVIAGGQECWWSLTGKPAFDESGVYLGYVGAGSDVSERKIAERRMTRLAHHDTMTGLLNRTKFTELLNQAVARLERYGAPFSVLYLDLDQFKSVNDTRGHMVGDKLLVQVAQRVQRAVRDTDVVARLGGDEFAIILPNDAMAENVAKVAARLLDDVKRPYDIEGELVSVGVSIGIALAPMNGTQPDEILRHADLALYRAKADGRSVFRFFESQMDSEARERRLLEVELRDALKSDEMVLHYQPLVSAADGQPTGFEALVRWNHPIRGLVQPAEFIPMAEQSNLIVDIGDWAILQACQAAASWPDHLTVAVNLSAKHFRRSDIALVVKRALAASGIAPERLEIEITEGLLMESLQEVTEKLAELRAIGVTIAMDDFGTGYSSLSYLLKFQFDRIKIDRSFVEASSSDSVARDILKAIASLGRTLKLKITAEGVETQEQAEFLSGIACHQLQGFYFSPPLDPVELPHYLLTSVPARARQLKAKAEAALNRAAG
jgi:diguanylate cyclase (GGDEF)-like protein/PAS domain S-box-containing protein